LIGGEVTNKTSGDYSSEGGLSLKNWFGLNTVFFCGTFKEEREERKTLPTGVEVITPIETRVRQYFQWDQGVQEMAWITYDYFAYPGGPLWASIPPEPANWWEGF